jgi:NTE family protein
VVEKTQRFLKNRFYMVQAMFKPGLLSANEFRDVIDYFIPDIRIEDTRVPFRAVATDLVSGEEIVLDSGSIRQAVVASCSVPGAIAPVKEGDKLLSDGGITCLIPCSVARTQGTDVVIAVAVDRDIASEEEFRTVMGVYYRVSEIMGHRLKCYELMEADVVIFPDVGDLHWSSFSQAMTLIREGETAAEKRMDDIRQAVAGKERRRFSLRTLMRSRRERT